MSAPAGVCKSCWRVAGFDHAAALLVKYSFLPVGARRHAIRSSVLSVDFGPICWVLTSCGLHRRRSFWLDRQRDLEEKTGPPPAASPGAPEESSVYGERWPS